MTTYIDLKGNLTSVELLDEDNMVSDSATKGATQQSIKAYVDASAGGGKILQQVYAEVDTTASFATAIPIDNTIPQNTEGTEQVTVTITPTSATSTLVVEALFKGANSSGNRQTVLALFRDSGADAIYAGQAGTEGTGAAVNHYEACNVSAGSTSATTFKMRFGSDSGTCYRNADFTGTRVFGGVCKTWIRVTELGV